MKIMCGYCRSDLSLENHLTLARIFGTSENIIHCKCGKQMKVEIILHPYPETTFDPNATPIEDELKELAKDIPQEEWDKLKKHQDESKILR